MVRQNNTSPSRKKRPSKDGKTEVSPALRDWLAQHRDLMAIFLDAYCVVDINNQVVDFNLGFTELCGLSYRKTLKTSDFCKLLKTEYCPVECPGKQILKERRPVRIDEVKAEAAKGTNLRVIVGGVPIFGPEKGAIGALLTIRNVSDENAVQKKYLARKEESVTDGLTHLYNKQFVEEMIIRNIRTATRELKSFSVVMCDIDHFKQVNDLNGHQANDYVLTIVAQLLKGEVHKSDVVGRFGGEEFIVMLHANNVAGAQVFGERFRAKIDAAHIKFSAKVIPLTVSVGTATFNKKWQKGMDVETLAKDLISEADQALYYAKRNGRNQVCQYENITAKRSKKVA